ncbi:ABC transporter ATP-binding protein [Synergistales bacterium]|nr:ABC transporter ATP-binding protein [Synergistales bacterium]
MNAAIMKVNNLSINFGGVKAVDNVSLDIRQGSITSIIGPNGAGKTTFFNIISGIYKPTSGTATFDGKEITGMKQHEVSKLGISRTFQNIRLFDQLDILRNVQTAMDARADYSVLEALLNLPKKWRTDRENVEKSMQLLKLVGLEGNAQDKPGSLPYGKQRRLELARALASYPKLLLLDEPAAGLNPTELDDFINLIRAIQKMFPITILLIEHRLHVVNSLSERVYVLNFGKLLAEGTVEDVKANQEVITAYMGEEDN